MLEVYQKEALTFEQQLERLSARGLYINNHTQALTQLNTISYYRLSAYWYPFRSRDINDIITNNFIQGTSFGDVVRLYEFDRRLRLLVIDAIERIEVYIRTTMTYQLSHAYGAFGHMSAENFHPKFDHAKWLKEIEKEINRSRDAFITHYKNKYIGFPVLPIWMITEVMTFGSLSRGFDGLKNEDKKIISKKLNLHYKKLANWLRELTYIRNTCAHHSRLWNRELAIRPEKKGHDNNWNPPITPRNDRIFYILLIIRQLIKSTSNGEDWRNQCNELIDPIAENPKWRIAMGMPEFWKEHPVWN